MALYDPEPVPTDALRYTQRLATLRILCLVEAASLLTLLLVAVPLKYIAGYTLAVSLVGPFHGLAFLALGWMALQLVGVGDISWRVALKLMLAACMPFGGLYSWWRLR